MKEVAVQKRDTRKEIVEAFWRLFEEKPLDSISVKDITIHAGCNRSTFYTYFNNATEVLESIEDRLYEKIQITFFSDIEKPTYEDILNHDIDDFRVEAGYLFVLFGENGDPKFVKKVLDLFSYTKDELKSENLSMREATYVKEFIRGGFLFVMLKWFEAECQSPVDEVTFVTKEFLYTETKLLEETRNRLQST